MLGAELGLDDLRYGSIVKLNEGSHLANAIFIARLINGIGTGMLNVIVPVWVCCFFAELLYEQGNKN